MSEQNLNDAARKIQDYLRHLADGEPEWHFYSTLLNHGRFWTPSPCPTEFGHGAPHHCFANSFGMLHALEKEQPGRYRYAEGWATSPDILFLPIHHAWLVDEEGRVLDWTWDCHDGTAYFGFSFSTDFVLGRDQTVWGQPLFQDADVRRAHTAHPLRRRKPQRILIEQLAGRETVEAAAVLA